MDLAGFPNIFRQNPSEVRASEFAQRSIPKIRKKFIREVMNVDPKQWPKTIFDAFNNDGS